MISEAEIRAQLNRIVDPCSVAAGMPAGLQDMGLIRGVTIEAGTSGRARITVVVAVTEFGCLMGAPFAHEAYERLSALPDVEQVEVALCDKFDWTPGDMDAQYRARLTAHRKQRERDAVPIAIVRS